MREPDFEMSADMRLLELQRGALGLPPRERHAWESRGTEGGLPVAEEPEALRQGAILTVATVALPSEGVIPGAVVTLTMSIVNEGAAGASEVLVSVPQPGGAAYRPGSFCWNERSTFDDVAEKFFGSGLAIGEIAAGERATFTWKIGVRLGTKPLVLAPHVSARGAAVVGARPLSIGRKAAGTSAFAGEMARADAAVYEPRALIPVEIPAIEIPAPEPPFYELDTEEQLVHEAAEAALSTAAPKAAPFEATPPLETPAQLKPEPTPAEPEPPAPEPEPARTEPVPVREAVLLYGRFDRTTLAFFERVFEGSRPPTILQHCIFGGALACPLDAGGGDPASLKRHLDAQSQVLHRIVLHEKLGKKEPIAEYAGAMLAELDRLAAAPIQPFAGGTSKDALLLVSELSDPTRAVLTSLARESARWDFVKARQLTLALQAQSAAGELESRLRTRLEETLRAYAQISVTVLQKLFVRIRIDRTTGLLFATEPGLDAAAKAVLAAIKSALA